MKYNNGKKVVKGALLALLAVTLTAGPSLALDLAAVPGQWLPPGGVSGEDEIQMWGFVDLPPGTAASYTCPGAPVVWNGGPRLNAVPGLLTINVKNCLAADISVFIPGLAKAASNPLAPQLAVDGQGRERLISLDAIVAAGTSGSYSWIAKEGTYLYQSGTDIRTQVPMGLYGALVVTDTSDSAAYPAVAQDEVLLFSEIDPLLNADPDIFGGARVSNWNPQYFLINGQTYPETADIAIDVSTNVLMRFVNAGLQTFAPTLGGGLYMDVIAEDGNLYPYPLTQYGIELTAGKTFDAIVNVGSPGIYPLYDRAGHLTNGGLVVNIQAGAVAGAPVAVNDSYSVAEDAGGGLVVTAPGVLSNDLNSDGNTPIDIATATAGLMSTVSSGTLTLSDNGSFTYIPNGDFNGSDQFTYVANDGAGGLVSNVATVSITVTPVNDAVPVANDDTYEVAAGSTLNVDVPGVLANDTDIDGDSMTAALSGEGPIQLTFNPNGSFSFDASAIVANSVANFNYVANDGTGNSNVATVTITVISVPLLAVDDVAEVQSFKGNEAQTSVTINVVENDEGDIVSVALPTTITQRGGTVSVNNSSVTYYPKRGFRGSDTFQYIVSDNGGATSTATVLVNVL